MENDSVDWISHFSFNSDGTWAAPTGIRVSFSLTGREGCEVCKAPPCVYFSANRSGGYMVHEERTHLSACPLHADNDLDHTPDEIDPYCYEAHMYETEEQEREQGEWEHGISVVLAEAMGGAHE